MNGQPVEQGNDKMLNLYDVCIDVSVGAISIIFHSIWQKFLPDVQHCIQDVLDLLAGLVRGE